MLDPSEAAELVNFGACAGFMAANPSVLGHSFLRSNQRRGLRFVSNLVLPILGFGVCFYIWLSVLPLAMRLGAPWTAAGLVYLAFLTPTFKRKLADPES
jgi:hypothetical protein